MIYKTQNTHHRKRAITRFEQLLKNGATIELTEKKPKRSISQNRYLHLILGWFAYETGYTLQEVKQYIFKQLVNPAIFYDGEVGELVPVQRWRSSADLDTKELTIAIDKFRDYSSSTAGIYLPEPKDLATLVDLEIELKNNKII